MSSCRESNDVAMLTFLLLAQIRLGSGAGDTDTDAESGVAEGGVGSTGSAGGGSGGPTSGFLYANNSTFSTGQSKGNGAFGKLRSTVQRLPSRCIGEASIIPGIVNTL